jgi:hypothetical protein
VTRWLRLRAGLGAAGVALGVAGMAMELRELVWGAVALLVPALLLRFAERREPAAPPR